MLVLITGAGGQLGHDLVRALADQPTVAGRGTAVEVVAADHQSLDVCDRDCVLAAFEGLRPDVVVHTAAWTAVDACEGDPDRAYRINALGTRNVVEAARREASHVCYVSTDYVFDGRSERAYNEWDRPNPLSAYGRSKLGGELELDPGATIVRTSWVCGARGANIVKTVLRLSQGDGPLAFVDDQRGAPTFTFDLAGTVRHLALDRRPGLFHVTNQGSTTWFDLAKEVLALAGRDPERVKPISTADLYPPRPAPRPANSVLDNAALRLSGLSLLPDWHESLKRLTEELLHG